MLFLTSWDSFTESSIPATVFCLHILFPKSAGWQLWGQFDLNNYSLTETETMQFISTNTELRDNREGVFWVPKSSWKFRNHLIMSVTQQGLHTPLTVFRKSNWQHQKNNKLTIPSD